MVKPFLSVIIPAYNEEDNLPLTLIEADKFLSRQNFSYEILVVDDNSDDNTKQIADGLVSVIKNLKAISGAGRMGKGAALKLGITASKGNWRMIIDAANSIPVSEISKITDYFSASPKFEIIAASRYSKSRLLDKGAWLRFGNIIEWKLNFLIRKMFKIRQRDFFLNFQCISDSAVERIFPRLKLVSENLMIEALVLAEKEGIKIGEIGNSEYIKSVKSKRSVGYLKTLGEIIKIRWWLYRGKYTPQSSLTNFTQV